MVTKIVLIFAVVAVVVAGAVFYSIGHDVTPTVVEQEAKQEGLDYSVGIKYPFFSGVQNANDLNDTVWSLLNGKASEFKRIVRRDNPSGLAVAHKNGFYVEYTMVVFNPQLATVRLKITSYFIGDEHPNTTTETFSYDLGNNSVIPTPL